MRQINKLITMMIPDFNYPFYRQATLFFITLLIVQIMVFFSALNKTYAQTSIVVSEKTTARFEGVFHGIGGVSFPFGGSDAEAVSANGAVVVGSSESTDGIDRAFRWNFGVLESLGTLPGGNESISLDISKDGTAAVGYATLHNGLFEAFRWTEKGGMEGLGFLHSGEGWSEAWGVSADGSVVVGRSYTDNGPSEAFRWKDGVMKGLGDLPGGSFSSVAFDVSADGSVVVGESESGKGDEAFIWTKEEGMKPLLTGGRYHFTTARGISANGSVVVGLTSSNDAAYIEAFRIDLDEIDFESLGDLPGGRHISLALDVSSDGSIIVGRSHTGVGSGDGFEAFIWTDSPYGMRNLKKVLEDVYGLDLTGWILHSAENISVSDRGIITIVGTGTNPDGKKEGWRVALPVFPGVGDFPGDIFYSRAFSISADGLVIVGKGTSGKSGGGEAFRWEDGTMEGLGGLSKFIESGARAVSADGSVIVGESQATSGIGIEAFRWTAGNGMMGLGDLPGGSDWPFSKARAVSADGAVVVGRGESEEGFEAFRWESGHIEGLGDFPEGRFSSQANGVSADGSIVVGRGLTKEGFEAFRWTEDDGMVGLGTLPGGNFSSAANAVSADGAVVVGGSSSKKGYEAFRWTEENGMAGLGDLPGDDFSSTANAVSADGSIVVGKSRTDEGFPFGIEAFIWTKKEGMQNLKDLAVKEYGAILNDWVFAEATDVALDDNTVIVTGYGMNPLGLIEGFRIPLTGIASNSNLILEAQGPKKFKVASARFNSAGKAMTAAPVNLLDSPGPVTLPEMSTFRIAVNRGQHVTVEVYDTTGRRLRTLFDGPLPADMNRILTFDATALPRGEYVIRTTGEDFSKSLRIMHIQRPGKASIKKLKKALKKKISKP